MAEKSQKIELENLTRGFLDLGSFEHDGRRMRVCLGSRDDIAVGVENPDIDKGEVHSPIKTFPRGVIEQGIKLKAWQGMVNKREIRIAGSMV